MEMSQGAVRDICNVCFTVQLQNRCTLRQWDHHPIVNQRPQHQVLLFLNAVSYFSRLRAHMLSIRSGGGRGLLCADLPRARAYVNEITPIRHTASY